MAACRGVKANGEPCKARVEPGQAWCRWHDPTPEGRQRHLAESRRGGTRKAYSALAEASPIAETLDLDAIDLTTPAGVMTLLGATLGQLARLPFDVRTANAIGQCATAQRQAIETTSLAARLEALEAAAAARAVR